MTFDSETARAKLARQILEDEKLLTVLEKAKALIRTGFSAGSIYDEIWIRDFATFMELACEVQDREKIRENLLMFFRFQGDDGHIVDGFVPVAAADKDYDYIEKASVPGFFAHKNTVETDQESSLVHAISKYVDATGDHDFLQCEVDGKTVLERMEWAFEYLLAQRFSEEHGLLWGGTTADWGDVQPESEWGVFLDESSHLSIDIYNNALFISAVNALVILAGADTVTGKRWATTAASFHESVRKQLWDEERQKFRPHVYLDASPFPADFDEDEIFYHGGTAVAIQADLLSRKEIAVSLAKMSDNVRKAGAQSIGLTLYPAYPDGFFKNPILSTPYTYQNGGDWTWFGGRMIQELVRTGFVEESYREIQPMVARVLENDGFFEWHRLDGTPSGSGTYRGSAGVLGRAIQMLLEWAERH